MEHEREFVAGSGSFLRQAAKRFDVDAVAVAETTIGNEAEHSEETGGARRGTLDNDRIGTLEQVRGELADDRTRSSG